jgi:CheY-like chemotaxis protein
LLSIDSVLVVEDSQVLREVMKAVLTPHAKVVETAASVAEALEVLRDTPDFSLLLSDVQLPDGTGFDVLAHVRRSAPESRAVLMTARWEAADAERATAMGALAYLPKPLTFRDIARVLRKADCVSAHRPTRRRSSGKALLRDGSRPGVPHFAWEMRDLSVSGAFLETKGPLAVGTSLDLELVLGADTIRVLAVVARLQEPSWAGPGGVGVRFQALDAEARVLIEQHVAAARDDTF